MLPGKLPVSLLISYSVFSLFEYYHTLHARTFRGSSRSFGLLLNLSAFLGMVFGLGFLLYYGYAVKWYLPAVLLAVSLVVDLLFFALVEAYVGWYSFPFVMSLSAFIVLPTSGFVMIVSLPAR
jgi:hypothetical protein